MKVSLEFARELASAAGVPVGLAVRIVDWNLSLVSEVEARIGALAAAMPPEEVAYIEYDAYPGFRFQEVLRDMVGYHCRDVQDVKERREQTMAILGFVANAGQYEWIRNFVQGEIQRLQMLTVEQFDHEFNAGRKGFRKFELAALFASNGLRCWFEKTHFEGNGHVFVGRGDADERVERAPNALYHEVAYPEFLHAGLHPERLATMARIFGLTPPPIEKCRVLELGCGVGVTVLNCALDLRSSSFVGIDFSKIQIEEAKSGAERLGLDNVTFLAIDIADFDAALGEFDYIVAHGMYSWVPEPVRQKMLMICRDRLSPHGIAYVSFNAKPGYRFPGMLRDIGLDCAGGQAGNLTEAAAAFDRMRNVSLEELPPLRQAILAPYVEHFSSAVLGQAIYDELADINNPFSFDEFASEAKRFGLQFFAESDIKAWSTKTLQANAQQLLDGLIEDPVRRIQYRDLLYLTRFHASLLCREERKPAFSPLPAMIDGMLFTLRGKPGSANPDVRGETSELFIGPGGVEVNIADPLLKAALVILYLEHPVRYPFDRLLSEASELAAVPPDAEKLKRWLQPLWETAFLDVHCHMPAIVTEPGEKPVAHSLARLCAMETRKVPSMLGSGAEVADETDRELLQLLDGTRDREALERALGLNHDELSGRLQALARLGLLVP